MMGKLRSFFFELLHVPIKVVCIQMMSTESGKLY